MEFFLYRHAVFYSLMLVDFVFQFIFCRIHMAPFSDEFLYVEIANKAYKFFFAFF